MKQLDNKIKLYIYENGPITFEQFMEFSLYDEEFGYYTKNIENIGKKGDFYTSPTVHRAFGEIISDFISEGSKKINSPRLSIIEIGSGNGYLALDILNSLNEKHGEIYNRINYYCIDISDKNLQNSSGLLNDHIQIVNFKKDISEISEPIDGFVLSNELFDSIPFHRIKFSNNLAKEIYVNTKDNKFIESLGEIIDSSIIRYIDELDINFSDDQQIEINTRYPSLIKNISDILNSGFLLTFDYGYLNKELYSRERFDGTYRCYFNHKISDNPYINIGFQDITCSVDFSSLIEYGTQCGLETMIYTTQGQFLVDWGILKIMEKASVEDRAKIKNLILPGTMGDKFKLLIQVKNLGSLKLNFYPESNFKINYQNINDRLS